MMLIKATRTGNRIFGSGQPPKVSTVTIAGAKLRQTESDTWSSGGYAGDGEYIRCVWLETTEVVDPWPNIKAQEPTHER